MFRESQSVSCTSRIFIVRYSSSKDIPSNVPGTRSPSGIISLQSRQTLKENSIAFYINVCDSVNKGLSSLELSAPLYVPPVFNKPLVNVLQSFIERRSRSIIEQSFCLVNRRDDPRFCIPFPSLNVHDPKRVAREPVDLVRHVNDPRFRARTEVDGLTDRFLSHSRRQKAIDYVTDVRPVSRFSAVTGNRQGFAGHGPVKEVGDDVAVSTR